MRVLRQWLSNRRRVAPIPDQEVAHVPASPTTTSRAGTDHHEAASEAITRIEAGRLPEALKYIDHALEEGAEDDELRLARALALFAWGRYHEAHAAFLVAMRAGMRSADALVKLGWTCLWLDRIEEAASAMRSGMEVNPRSWAPYFGLASVLRAEKRITESKDIFERAAMLAPESPHCLSALIDAHIKLANYREAERLARMAIDKFPSRPASYADLGIALCSQGWHDQAIAAFEQAEALQASAGDMGEDAVNYAICLLDAGRTERALAMLERRMRHDAHEGLHAQYALALLIAGRFAEGWREYEFRWIEEPLLSARPNFVKPHWGGQDLRGKTVLVWTEQGFGDFIQFARYIPQLKALGATVAVFLREELRELAQTVSGVDLLLGSNEPYPPFDYYVNLLSLPRIFGTDLDSIPCDVPYVSATPDRGARWSRRIGAHEGIKVGLAWAGSSTHTRDRFRSMTLAQLAPLLEVGGIAFFSLQKGKSAEELVAVPALAGVVDLAPDLHDFAETAAAIDNLDLVIGVDTAVVHLAGALAKPVWTLSATPADWRWLEEREDSPWYPTMRLFRQTGPGDWNGVIARTKRALEDFVRTARATSARAPIGIPAASPPPIVMPIRSETRVSGVAETRHGIMQYFPDERDAATAVEYYGEHRQCELDFVARLLAQASVVLEVDAGIGAHALWLARHVGPEGHLFLYEDDRMLKQALNQNLRANRIANTTLMRRRLRRRPRLEAGGSRPKDDVVEPDESIDELRLRRLDYLKINEGRRARDVLEGASETLWRLRPRLQVSFETDDALRGLAARARDFGYACWRCETTLYNPRNFNNRVDDRFAGRTALALLAFPEEQDVRLQFDECHPVA